MIALLIIDEIGCHYSNPVVGLSGHTSADGCVEVVPVTMQSVMDIDAIDELRITCTRG